MMIFKVIWEVPSNVRTLVCDWVQCSFGYLNSVLALVLLMQDDLIL